MAMGHVAPQQCNKWFGVIPAGLSKRRSSFSGNDIVCDYKTRNLQENENSHFFKKANLGTKVSFPFFPGKAIQEEKDFESLVKLCTWIWLNQDRRSIDCFSNRFTAYLLPFSREATPWYVTLSFCNHHRGIVSAHRCVKDCVWLLVPNVYVV